MYIELREPIFGYLLRLSGEYDLAEELTQETFLRALQALPKFRNESSLKTWLYAIARNTYLSKMSKERPKGIVLTSFAEVFMESGESHMDPAEQLLRKEQSLSIKRTIYNLPETYRTVIILREFEELSYGEIAKILGKTENWVRVTFYRAKQKLKEAYADLERRMESED
ncbi:RNA polymerase sigma-70 factor, ECF subfamily [Desulfitobacterium chlororespirans DSM 11544]|uniref:RNA polymerase sigma factor n=2 Tax=Desulfitobacterium chlororespirans TaxID=51616 RepID=A0A1M7UFK4_9FIRM|nr:RNA polymerase sigma-70 factor, ECF subfamily [Desulfitobacterium chlororespirans DSM 11544]